MSLKRLPYWSRIESCKNLLIVILTLSLTIVYVNVTNQSIAGATSSAAGYLPFPSGTHVYVIQANCDDPLAPTHCGTWKGLQYDYYAWDFGISGGSTSGAQIVSATSGTVIGLRSNFVGKCISCDGQQDFGNYVFVHNDDGTYMEYLHMMTGSIQVSINQHITVGTPIGRIGETGNASGPHLHISWLRGASGTGDSPSVGLSIPAVFLGIGHPLVGQTLVSNNVGAAASSGVADAYAYANRSYVKLLGRNADPSGIGYWGPVLASGAMNADQFSYALSTSGEYASDVISSYYKSYLGRSPDPGGLSQFLTAVTANGATFEQVRSSIFASSEFWADSGSTNSGFVEALYSKVLQRSPSSQELNLWVNALNNGSNRGAVASSFINSTEGLSVLVGSWYKTFLGRTGGAGEVALWVSALQGGSKDQAVIAAFLASPEFQVSSATK